MMISLNPAQIPQGIPGHIHYTQINIYIYTYIHAYIVIYNVTLRYQCIYIYVYIRRRQLTTGGARQRRKDATQGARTRVNPPTPPATGGAHQRRN